MVSMGDTEISLHIRGGGTLESNTQITKICLNFNFQGGYSGVKYSKCQDLSKFQFGGGGGSGLKFQRGALWRIWTKIYCLRLVYRNLLVHRR